MALQDVLKALPSPSFWHSVCSFWGCEDPQVFGLLLASLCCLSNPLESTLGEHLVSPLICKAVPFRVYVSEWGTEEELTNSIVDWSGTKNLQRKTKADERAHGRSDCRLHGMLLCPPKERLCLIVYTHV